MTERDYRSFLSALEEIIPFEARNALAHLVLVDCNYDDHCINFCLDWIAERKYSDSPAIDLINKHPEYVAFVKGFLEMLLLIDSDYRQWMQEATVKVGDAS